jgi:hypothetical protein
MVEEETKKEPEKMKPGDVVKINFAVSSIQDTHTAKKIIITEGMKETLLIKEELVVYDVAHVSDFDVFAIEGVEGVWSPDDFLVVGHKDQCAYFRNKEINDFMVGKRVVACRDEVIIDISKTVCMALLSLYKTRYNLTISADEVLVGLLSGYERYRGVLMAIHEATEKYGSDDKLEEAIGKYVKDEKFKDPAVQ